MRRIAPLAVICLVAAVIAGCSSSSSGPSLIDWFNAATWQSLSDFPPGSRLGAALVSANGGTLYAIAGGTDDPTENDFWRYDIALDQWVQLADTIDDPYWAASLAWAGGDTIYMIQGNGVAGFSGYSVSDDTWYELADFPGTVRRAGHSLVWPRQGGYLYCCEGDGGGVFKRYDIAADAWESLASIPRRMWHGNSIEWGGGNTIYAAADSLEFYAYDISMDAWTPRADYPDELDLGAWLSYDGHESLFLARGDTTSTIWRYDIPTDAWESIEDAPETVTHGGTMVSVDEALYLLPGGTSTLFWALKE